MRLAVALLEAGQSAEAADNYEACLRGPFASDPEILMGAAHAQLASERPTAAMAHLQAIRTERPDYRAEQVTLLYAKALAASNRHEEASAEYRAAVEQFGSFEARAEYARALEAFAAKAEVQGAVGVQRVALRCMTCRSSWPSRARTV